MPRQFAFKGDRLAFSHGIILLAAAASLLLVVFGGVVTRLIPLYAVGVFLSFTLSQSGMVRHWWRLRETGWRTSMVINGVGASMTAVVVVIIATTKFTHGAWISILLMAVLVLMFALIGRHYGWFERAVRVEKGEFRPRMPDGVSTLRRAARQHVVLPVGEINKMTLAAVDFARELSGKATAVHLADDREEAEEFRARWEKMIPDIPLLIVESPYRAFVAPMLAYVESVERSEPDVRITVVLHHFAPRHWWERLLHNQDALGLKPHLRKWPRVGVVDLPYRLEE
jgi:hypothetical protein